MENQNRRTAVTVMVGFALAAIVLACPDATIAQVRPALVKNTDEAYRQPYQVYAEFFPNTSGNGCQNPNCSNFTGFSNAFLFDLPVVPAGKRLVIRHVSGRLGTGQTAELSVYFQDSQIFFPQNVRWSFFGPFFSTAGGGMAAFGSDANFSYGPGERPHVNLFLPGHNNYIGYITVSGYLIDAAN